MAEQLRQENFDNLLGAKPAETQKREYEIINCQHCEDAGACSFCSRGRQWAEDNPLPKESKPRKKR